MAASPDTIKLIENWLKTPVGASPLDEIETLNTLLAKLAENPAPPSQQFSLLDGLHARVQPAIEASLPKLYAVRLPISPNTRRSVRAMQEVLELLARLHLDLIEAPDAQLINGSGAPPEVTLWRIFHALGRHLLLSDLTTTPHPPGIWLTLHRTYLAARRHRVERRVPFGAQYDLQSLYVRILLLSALPASAVSAQEWGFAYRLILKLAASLQLSDTVPEDGLKNLFWVAPERDSPPTHLERKAPPDDTLAFFIQYRGVIDELRRLLVSLSATAPPAGFLPDDISPRTAQVTLTHLLEHLEAPKKRRFPRRRQGYRANLCLGFSSVAHLLKTETEEPADLSEWMIVNESPGGYSAMHVAGKPSKVQVGDLIGMRRDGETNWGICVVRWAISENQEHLELGLKEIAPRANLGYMATMGVPEASSKNEVILLPALPPLRNSEAIAFRPEMRPASNKRHSLVLTGKNVEIREFMLGESLEQSADVDIFLVT